MPRKKERVKRKVIRDLKLAMNPQDAKEIVEELQEEAANIPEIPPERVPGATIHGMKVIWTYKDMVAKFPIVAFTPEENVPLTWNGVTVQAIVNQEMHVPKPFHDLYRKWRRGAPVKAELIGTGITIEPAAGMLE